MVDPFLSGFMIDSMRLGLISDVHGDIHALNHALHLLYEQHGVDAVWCAGDLVGRGSHPDEVVERVVGSGMPTVMGNHDEMMLTLPFGEHPLGQLLGYQSRTMRLLNTLPRTYRAHIGKQTLVMVHGSPRSNTESITLKPSEQGHGLAWLSKIGANILIAGHTHAPMALAGYHGLVVNPGSLFNPSGFGRSSSETYGVLDVEEKQFAYYPLWQ